MQRRNFLLMTGAAVLAACQPAQIQNADRVRFVVLRHADRTPPGQMLNDVGRARAAALPSALAGVPIDAIYSADYQRNLDTVAPLARQRGLTPTVVEQATISAGLLPHLANGRAGQTVLWVGNSTNLRTLWVELGARGNPPVNYGEISIVDWLPNRDAVIVRQIDWQA